jgi:hypothetical protein
MLTQAATIPIYGRLADQYGRRRVFTPGSALFFIGSALCGWASGMIGLILFRALQGRCRQSGCGQQRVPGSEHYFEPERWASASGSYPRQKR